MKARVVPGCYATHMKDRSVGVIPFRIEHETRHYLILRQTKGHWGFPKGHPEAGETDVEAALRELSEETGIATCTIIPGFRDIQHYSLEQNAVPIERELLLFVGETADEKTVVQPGETEEIVWLPYEEARERITYSESKGALDAAERFLRSLAVVE